MTSHDDKAEALLDFYTNLIGTSQPRGRSINLDALGIQQRDLTGLETSFSVEEVWNTIQLFPSDKVPGPNGFTGRFYKSCWTIIKDDIMLAFDAVWRRYS